MQLAREALFVSLVIGIFHTFRVHAFAPSSWSCPRSLETTEAAIPRRSRDSNHRSRGYPPAPRALASPKGNCDVGRLVNAALSLSSSPSPTNGSSSSPPRPVRAKLRDLTGFSLTAFLAPLRRVRRATRFSLTAFRTTVRGVTGISLSGAVSSTARWTLDIFHPGLRYFLQPFLMLYFFPMMVMRYWVVGPTRDYYEESLRGHEKVVEGWKNAVEAAEAAQSGGYWPVHLDDNGIIVMALPPNPSGVLDLTDGIEQSVAATASLGFK